MRIAILGAGAIGSIFAAHLVEGGHDVVLIARGERLRALREQSVKLAGLRSLDVEVAAAEADDVRDCDALLVATKTYNTEQALASIAHIRCGLVCSLQNGTLKNTLLERTFGEEPVVGACTMIGGTLGDDGVVDFFLDEETFVGELDGRRSERVDGLVAALAGSGLPAHAVEDIRGYEWTKQANQASSAGISALSGLPVAYIWSDRRLAEVVVGTMRETVMVARASGVEPTPDPRFGFDVPALADAPLDEALAKVDARGQGLIELGKTKARPSLAVDVAAGRPSELEETIGHVVREGERLGVPTPLLAYSYAVIRAIEAGRGLRTAPIAATIP